MDKKLLAIIIAAAILAAGSISYLLLQPVKEENIPPEVTINHPADGAIVSDIVMISGDAHDPESEDDLIAVEVKIQDEPWAEAEGLENWSYTWDTSVYDDGEYTISVRARDYHSYSKIEEIVVRVRNEDEVNVAHKWGVFVAASNFPEDDEKKLGNGGLYFAENLSTYLINEAGYPASHITILFDDGWIRSKNGAGVKQMTLQQRNEIDGVHYGGATNSTVHAVLTNTIQKANRFDDSEVFLWFFSHGVEQGINLFQKSAIFLWDDILVDDELGAMLNLLDASQTCIIIDACHTAGFADKSVFDMPSLFRAGVAKKGRIVMTGASKFTKGYASTLRGPLFSLLWFEGLRTGEADGYRPGLLNTGRKTRLRLFKNGQTSVEEAFYYARHVLRSSDYKSMQPQINDRYPRMTLMFNRRNQMYLT